MIRLLRVRDLALVAEAEIELGPGLNLLTGETGSGKSLIVDALTLALGARASSEQVRHGAERAVVEALFDLEGAPGALGALVEIGWEQAPELLLSREVGGRGGARINGRPATPALLRRLGRELVAVHGQNDQHSLMDAAAHARWTAARARLDELNRLQARGRREEEYLRWQLDELRDAALRAGEMEELEAERQVARHATRLSVLVEEALTALRDADALALAVDRTRSGADLDPRLQPLSDRASSLADEAADLGTELRRYRDGVDADPQRLQAIEDRLALIQALARKHGGTVEAAIAERERLEAALSATADLEGAIAEAEAAERREVSALAVAAAALTDLRTRGAADLRARTERELAGVRLEGARLEVALRPRLETGPDGAEEAEMLFSANPGEPPAPLARVASGGELSRVMLALRAARPELERTPTLVFDEVDTGIGGESARQVGIRLQRLGREHQVLVVTHLPQIACFADHHLVVEKGPGVEGRTVVSVRELATRGERAQELARMMSGRVTEKALARAQELLDEAASATGPVSAATAASAPAIRKA